MDSFAVACGRVFQFLQNALFESRIHALFMKNLSCLRLSRCSEGYPGISWNVMVCYP